jgi:hypothetical protein
MGRHARLTASALLAAFAAMAPMSVAHAKSLPSASANASKPPKCPNGKPNGNPYPPGQCKAQTSQSSVPQGGQITVSGDGFYPLEPVTIDLHSTVVELASVPADALGNVVETVTIPLTTPIGDHTLILTGLSSTNQLTAAITVTPATFGQTSSGGAVGSSGGEGPLPHDPAGPVGSVSASRLPFTGAGDVVPMSIFGGALVLTGTIALVALRRRRELITT